MTLKEKLRHSLTGHLSDEKTEVDVNIATIIAEEFAIEFAEWILSSGVYHQLIRTQKINKELLEIYKTEKGL